MYANLQEHEFYNLQKHPSLGRVYYCAPFGLFSVMKRYTNRVENPLSNEQIREHFNMFIYPQNVDNNGHNIYKVNDRYVLIDYGDAGLLYINNEIEW